MKQPLKMQKKIDFLIFSAYYCTIVIAILLTLKFIIPFFMPFIIGFLVAFLLKPLTRTISEKTKINHKICGTLVVIITYSIIVGFIWLICAKIIAAIQSFAINNQNIFETHIMPVIKKISLTIDNLLDDTMPSINLKSGEIFETITNSIDDTIVESSKTIIVWIAKIGATIPGFFIGLTFAIISSIYISSDYNNITKHINSMIPKKLQNFIAFTKGCTINTITKYIKACSVLMLLNFVALATGFFIIKIENPIGMAALTTICDCVPIFGPVIMILPWIVSLIIVQKFQLAIKISIVYALVNIARSFIEPKVVGKQMGMHPVITLIAIYAGLKLFGLIGSILFPIAAQIGASIYKINLNSNSNLKSN